MKIRNYLNLVLIFVLLFKSDIKPLDNFLIYLDEKPEIYKLAEELIRYIESENIDAIKFFISQNLEQIESIINQQIETTISRPNKRTPRKVFLTPLHLSCIKKNIEIINLLLINGGNPNDTQFYLKDGTYKKICGNTLFTTLFGAAYLTNNINDTCCEDKILNIIDLLISYKADVNNESIEDLDSSISIIDEEQTNKALPLIAAIILYLNYDEVTLKIVEKLLKNGTQTNFEMQSSLWNNKKVKLIEYLQMRLNKTPKDRYPSLHALIELFVLHEEHEQAKIFAQNIHLLAKLFAQSLKRNYPDA